MNKIREILDWYSKFNKIDIVIKTEYNEFELEISNKKLPHLLGVHYSSNNRLKGNRLYNFIKNKTDEEIYEFISTNNPAKLQDVVNRVESFKYFMENLDEAVLVEQTHPNTKIKSEHLLVKGDNGNYLQIGIARDREDTDYFETYIVRNDDSYFKDSKIQEKVVSIEKYEGEELVPFSFNEEKNKKLLDEYYSKKESEKNSDSFFVEDEPILYKNIPAELKNENRWAIIKIISVEEQKESIMKNSSLSEEEKENKLSNIKKANKIPISVNGELASSTDENTWSSYKEAVEFIKGKEKNHTLAFALGGGYIGIDLDDILEDGRAYMQDKEKSKSMTADFLRGIDTYAEMSPSGKGLHLIGKGELPGKRKRSGNLEIYDKDRFFTVTGRIIRDKDREKIININKQLKPLYDTYMPIREKVFSNKIYSSLNKSNDEVMNLFFNEKNSAGLSKDDLKDLYLGNWERFSNFPSQSEADAFVANRIAFYSGGNFEQTKDLMILSGLNRDKWSSKRGQITWLDNLINDTISSLSSVYVDKDHYILNKFEESTYYKEKLYLIGFFNNMENEINGRNLFDIDNATDKQLSNLVKRYLFKFNDEKNIVILDEKNKDNINVKCNLDLTRGVFERRFDNKIKERKRFNNHNELKDFLSGITRDNILNGYLENKFINDLKLQDFSSFSFNEKELKLLNSLKDSIVSKGNLINANLISTFNSSGISKVQSINIDLDYLKNFAEKVNVDVKYANVNNVNFNAEKNILFIPKESINFGTLKGISIISDMIDSINKDDNSNEIAKHFLSDFTVLVLSSKYDFDREINRINSSNISINKMAEFLTHKPKDVLETLDRAVKNANSFNKLHNEIIKINSKSNIKRDDYLER